MRTFRGVAVVPFCSLVTNQVTRLLSRRHIKIVFLSPPPPSKNDPWPIYVISKRSVWMLLGSPQFHACVPTIGQAGRRISIRKKEHQWCLWLGHIEMSALAHHALSTGHEVLFEEIVLMCKISSYNSRIVRESIEIWLSDEVINKEDSKAE